MTTSSHLNASPCVSPTRLDNQKGLTLIESLLGILLLALGILGILGVQMRAMTDARHGIQRMRAVHLIEDLSEKIRANPAAHALIGTFISHPNALQARDCTLHQPCTPKELAISDLANWHDSVRNIMVNGNAMVFSAMSADIPSPTQIGVIISWPHALQGHRDGWHKDALATFSPSFSSADSLKACPRGHTCHMQHLTLPAEAH